MHQSCNGEAGSAKSDVFVLGMTALQLLCGLSDSELAQLVHSGALDPSAFVRFRGKCSRQLIGDMCYRTEGNRPTPEDIEWRLSP